MRTFHISWLLCSLYFLVSHALIHHLTITEDARNLFDIETFGFMVGGKIDMSVKDFRIRGANKAASGEVSEIKAGFLIRRSDSESESQEDLEQAIESGLCILDSKTDDDLMIDMSDSSKWKRTDFSYTIPRDQAGYYTLIFARCHPSASSAAVSFNLYATFVNPGPNYLSAGEAPLPKLYLGMTVAFGLVLWTWCYVLYRKHADTANYIHHLMTLLLVVKCLSLLSESIRYHYISTTGQSEGWSVVYYIFTSLKGVLFFTVVMLIGTGWSLIKPFLSARERNIMFAVFCLQILDNIAMIVFEESAPGSQSWLTWRDVLHFVDIICCCAILFPIYWSINHYRQAAEADTGAQKNIKKLQLFREFYFTVFCYIYFTRIVVFLLTATVPFYLLWLGPLFLELGTLVFFIVTGYKFRPIKNNPYFAVSTEENDEYGLDEDTEIEMAESRPFIASGKRRETSSAPLEVTV